MQPDGTISHSIVDSNSSFAVQANGASNAIGLMASFLTGSPAGINALNGAAVSREVAPRPQRYSYSRSRTDLQARRSDSCLHRIAVGLLVTAADFSRESWRMRSSDTGRSLLRRANQENTSSKRP